MDDWHVGSFLKNIALLEMRAMARRAKPVEMWPSDDYVACIAWLADMCHNMPDVSLRRGGVRRISFRGARRERPFLYAWSVADPIGREWILDRLRREGIAWKPPGDALFRTRRGEVS
ncbi:hypothetical protein [Streptomyces avicenniae]|uniref:hypothetical protein n=1 Tax=Streptomyces avicenniae TaxID=500153 RepID=UPI00167E03C2|nr:hypothetical protein [Streptomyces avicenniae]